MSEHLLHMQEVLGLEKNFKSRLVRRQEKMGLMIVD